MMKLLLVLFLVSCASATLHEALEKATNDVVETFRQALLQSPPLHQVLGIEDNEIVRSFESDVKDELIKHVIEVFRKALERIDDAVRKGHKVHEEAVKQLKDLQLKLKDLKPDDVEEHEIEGMKKLVSDAVRQILEKMGLTLDKRDINDDPMQSLFPDVDFRDFFLKIKQMILEKMNVPSLKVALAKLVSQGADSLCRWLTNKGKEKVVNFFDRVLETDDKVENDLENEVDKRSVSDLYEEIKDYFENFNLEFKEKFHKFNEWVRNILEAGLDKSRNKIENVKIIARELLKKYKHISKEVASEALEYLHQYKDQLGSLYDDVRDKVMKRIMDYTD